MSNAGFSSNRHVSELGGEHLKTTTWLILDLAISWKRWPLQKVGPLHSHGEKPTQDSGFHRVGPEPIFKKMELVISYNPYKWPKISG